MNPIAIPVLRARLHPIALAVHLALAAAAMLPCAVQAQAAATASQRFAIPAGDLAGVLSQLARASGVAIAADAAKLQGLRSPGVQGEHSVSEALAAALRGSGYSAVMTGQGFTLVPATGSVATLQEVRIVGANERGYGVKSSSTATKTDTLLRDTPQSITVVTKELMRDQGTQSMADVIRYVPGVVTAQGEGNRDTAVFRGNSSTGDFYIDGIRDDVQYYRDFYNIDSVEALKGSNAMLFGRGGSGGVINRVSKQPQWSTLREASLTLGAWNNRRATVDLGQAVSQVAAVRINGMAERSDSYRAGAKVERAGINPTLALRLGANTSLVVGYEHFKDDRTADRGIPSQNGVPYHTEPSAFFGNAELSYTWSRVDAFTAVLDHDLGNGVSLRNRLRYADYDKFYQNVFANSAVKDNKLLLAGYNNATQRSNLFNQTDLTVEVATGAVRHKIATGLELGRQRTDNLRNTAYVGGRTVIEVAASNPRTAAQVSFLPAATDANNHGQADVRSVYVQDQLEFSPQWQVIAGLRYDRFSVDFTDQRINAAHPAPSKVQVTDTPLSPRVGLVYKPIEAVSLYGSYSMAFVPRAGDQLSSLTPNNKAFDPEKFTNLELGAKWDILPNLSASAAIYRLDRTNVLITDPLLTTQQLLVDGQQTKGIELGAAGNVTADWSVMGGYAFQDAQLTAAQSATVKNGAKLAQVPRHTLSLWNRVDLDQAWALALGVVYRDALYTATTNTVQLPAFTRFDGAVFYTIGKGLKAQLNIENLFDKKYYASANSDNNITPGSPRAVRLSLNARF